MTDIHTDHPRSTLPCPPWCSLPPGHHFGGTDPRSGMEVRGHGLSIGRVPVVDLWDGRTRGCYVDIESSEHAVGPDGPVVSTEPARVMVDGPGCGMNPQQARQVARYLEEAATMVEGLGGDDAAGAA